MKDARTRKTLIRTLEKLRVLNYLCKQLRILLQNQPSHEASLRSLENFKNEGLLRSEN